MESYAAAAEIQNSVHQPNMTSEPYLAQVDDMIVEMVERSCVEYGVKEVQIGDKIVRQRYIHGIKYPEIYNSLMLLSQLERTTYYTEDEALITWLDSKQIFRELRAKYRFNDEALDLIDKIERLRWTVVQGDAKHGMRQKHVAKVSGSTRELNINPSKNRSFFDRLRGR